jgi:hypothetical protein
MKKSEKVKHISLHHREVSGHHRAPSTYHPLDEPDESTGHDAGWVQRLFFGCSREESARLYSIYCTSVRETASTSKISRQGITPPPPPPRTYKTNTPNTQMPNRPVLRAHRPLGTQPNSKTNTHYLHEYHNDYSSSHRQFHNTTIMFTCFRM